MDESNQIDDYAIAQQERQKHVDAVLHSSSNKKLVVAGPGTGKTYIFKKMLQGKGPSLTLTFVNALVEDLSLELFGLSEVKTLHGFARSQLMKATRKGVNVYPKLSAVVTEDAEVLLGAAVDFDSLFHNRVDNDSRLDFYHGRRMYYDHYGFSDIVYTAALYFEKHPEKIPSYEQVVVDEFQDFNVLEVSLIELLATRSPILIAGDDDQALYESLKSASPKYIRERHASELHGYKHFSLPYCSRSTRVIVESANDIIVGAQSDGLLASRIQKPFHYFPSQDKDKESAAHPHVHHSHMFAKQIPWFIHTQITKITQTERDKYTVLILSPTRNQCRDITEALKSKGFQNVQFVDKADISEPSLLDGLRLLLKNKNCNLGWRIVVKAVLSEPEFESLLKETVDKKQESKLVELILPDLKRKVKRMLTTLRAVRDGRQVDTDHITQVFDHLGIDVHDGATQSLRDELTPPKQSHAEPGIRRTPIEVTTFQSSKGLTADYVFITHFDDRYCIRDKNRRVSDQDVCSFLVALTRARRAVYLLSTDQTQTPLFLSWIDRSRIYEI